MKRRNQKRKARIIIVRLKGGISKVQQAHFIRSLIAQANKKR